MLTTRAEEWKQNWLLEGRREGRREGRQEGEASLLMRLLECRFGPLPDEVRDRMLAADTATLEEWGARVLDADSLADVVETGQHALDHLQALRDILASRVKRWERDWRLKGFQEGRQEGCQEGEATLLLRLLERRFGPLLDEVRNRVLAADRATLEAWAVRVLDAGSLTDVLETRLAEDLPEVRILLATCVEQWKQDWLLEGRREGRHEGRQEGEAVLLLRQLERRFGSLPDEFGDRVLAADTATLEKWGVRVLDASSLADVLV
jgi:flagellar biosynthesis/type III secretory pathway protein FliH